MTRKELIFIDCVEIAAQMRIAYLAWEECARLAQKNLKTASREYRAIMRAGEAMHEAKERLRIEVYNVFSDSAVIVARLEGLDSLRGY